jgi:truncated hemoglobin YjbI
VEHDPILRPLFPSTFRCAIEEFSAFLVQFLGGEAEDTQRRWWLSLRESHRRFTIGPRERNAWLRAMTVTLGEASVIGDSAVSTIALPLPHRRGSVKSRRARRVLNHTPAMTTPIAPQASTE